MSCLPVRCVLARRCERRSGYGGDNKYKEYKEGQAGERDIRTRKQSARRGGDCGLGDRRLVSVAVHGRARLLMLRCTMTVAVRIGNPSCATFLHFVIQPWSEVEKSCARTRGAELMSER